MTNQKPTKTILLSYLSYLILFVGTAFVSGAIVHVGNISELAKYVVIGVLGVFLFITGSFIQEFVLNKENLKEKGIIKFFLFSLLLSVGIGMISGGTQHYSDFPTYSSYLIPIGLVLSLVAFILKNNYFITTKLWAIIIGTFLLISIPLHFGLITFANSLNAQSTKEKAEFCNKKTGSIPLSITAQASVGHENEECPTSIKTSSMNMSMSNAPQVKDDKTFIEYVIPHHQDAVDSSTKLLATTQDPILKAFLANVIKTQSQEITLLKGYHKAWFGIEYQPNAGYKSMMDLSNLTGKELEKTYIQGMLGHHSAIINVAKKVVASDLGYTYKPEIITLSGQIIKDQEADNIVLNNWLQTKYKNVATQKVEAQDHAH